jgi:hypothetical protein
LRDNFGRNAFLFAAMNSKITPQTLRNLVSKGFEVNLKDKNQSNAFNLYIAEAPIENKKMALAVLDCLYK